MVSKFVGGLGIHSVSRSFFIRDARALCLLLTEERGFVVEIRYERMILPHRVEQIS